MLFSTSGNFMDFYPMYQETSVKDGDRLDILEQAMEVALVHQKMYQGKWESLPEISPTERALIPCFTWNDEAWKVKARKIPAYDPDFQMEDVLFQDKTLEKRLGQLPKRGTIALELIPFLGPTGFKGDYVYPLMLLAYNVNKDQVLQPPLAVHEKGMSNREVWTVLLKGFIENIILSEGVLPKTILYAGKPAKFVLRDFCEHLGIQLIKTERIPELDNFYLNLMQGGMND